MKSSAASISILPRLSGRDAAPIRPSGAPVLKKKGSAEAAVAPARISPSSKIANEYHLLCMTSSLVRDEWFVVNDVWDSSRSGLRRRASGELRFASGAPMVVSRRNGFRHRTVTLELRDWSVIST